MLRRIFKQRDQGTPPVAPLGSRVYAIGDIHGCHELLRDLLRLIHEDAYRAQARRNVVVYLGDYIDRGTASREVIDLLLHEPLPGFETVCLRGNHEDSALRFLEDLTIGPGWLAYGGAETLASYGIEPPVQAQDTAGFARAQRELAERMPPSHLRFLRGLPLSHVEGDYFFVHAGVRPGVPIEAQQSEDLLWIRDEFLRSSADFGKIVVHGHTISADPDVQRNRIGIDTGAFATGRLTCLVLEGTEWSFLQT